MTQAAAVASAETLATLRAVVANETRLAVRCVDHFAEQFIAARSRILARVLPQSILRALFDRLAPGSYCFTIARTRHFDEALLAACRAGVEQVVLLGAGYDSRAFRFANELFGINVFEVDHPGTQARKRRILEAAQGKVPGNLRFVALDFTAGSLEKALADSGFDAGRRTLFLWEGVSYYLPLPAIASVLDLVARCAPGSSIMLDYAIKSFVDGDTSTYGGREVAAWLKKIGEPFLFGLDPGEVAPFLADHKLRLISDVGPADLESRYLETRAGVSLGQTLGHVHILQAEVPSA
jgi:methyltransferase (TIGR00027 family)